MSGMQDTGRRFESTSWTLIARARNGEADLEALLGNYWPPVYAYLRRHGRSRDDAADLTQAFICEVVIGRKLLHKADPARGKFRSLLIGALKNFVRDEDRKLRGRLRHDGEADAESPRPTIAYGEAALEAAEPRDADDPADAFNRQWAAMMFDIALARVERACRRDGLDDAWLVFEERVMRKVRGGEPTPFAELLPQTNATDEQQLYSMLQTMQRKVQRELRAVIAETVGDDPDEVEAELRDLKRFLEG